MNAPNVLGSPISQCGRPVTEKRFPLWIVEVCVWSVRTHHDYPGYVRVQNAENVRLKLYIGHSQLSYGAFRYTGINVRLALPLSRRFLLVGLICIIPFIKTHFSPNLLNSPVIGLSWEMCKVGANLFKCSPACFLPGIPLMPVWAFFL